MFILAMACLMLVLETDGYMRNRLLAGAGVAMAVQIGQWM